MESRLPLAADLAQAALEQPADDAPSLGGELYLPGSIAGRVVTAGDAGLGDVNIALLAADGRVLAERLTADDGAYDFPALAPGWYAIRETQPAGYDDGDESIGTGGGETLTNDVISAIYVAPGRDLHGYNFAEWRPVDGEATTPAAPLPDAARAVTAFNLVPPTIVQWQRPAEPFRNEAIAEEAVAAATTPAPVAQRRGEPIFASGGERLDLVKFDFEAVLAEGYDLLAALFEAVDAAELVPSEGAPAAGEREQSLDHARAPDEERESPRERAFSANEPVFKPESNAPESTPENQPLRRTRAPLQVAGKPAA